MRRYSSYKDSGVQWIGVIPTHWEVGLLGRYFIFGKGLPITKADLQTNGIEVVSYGQIHAKNNTGISISDDMLRYVSERFIKTHSQCLLNKQDFVFADTSEDIEGSGHFAYNDRIKRIFAGYHTLIARPRKVRCPIYYAFLFKSNCWKPQVQSLVNGVKVYSISKGILKKTFITIPNIEEQLAISNYLKVKSELIDEHIAQRGQEIALLEQLKQAVIAHAVTKGLNPNVPVKESGIAWIGEIPSHWEVHKIKNLFRERSQKGFPNEPVLCATQKYGVIPQSMYENRVVVVNKGLEGLKLVEKGDFVISLRSFQGGIEYAHYRGIISAAYTILILSEAVNSQYIKHLFKSTPFIGLLKVCVTGIREGQNINYEVLKKNHIMLPPLSEQRAIVEYIDSRVAKIDGYIADVKAEIEHLKEFKQRLISDAVTGQIKVIE